MHEMDIINRRARLHDMAGRQYCMGPAPRDKGERRIFALVSERHVGGTLLDLNVGDGRTTGLLAPFARGYVGTDSLREGVHLARLNHPGHAFELADPRDLPFADASFDVVIFSRNGLDMVDGADRASILREVSRVLRRGGTFAFSSFNREWCGFVASQTEQAALSAGPLQFATELVRHGVTRWRVHRHGHLEQHGEHAILLHPRQDCEMLVYATTPGQLCEQLRMAGFDGKAVIVTEGGGAPEPDGVPATETFHIAARKAQM